MRRLIWVFAGRTSLIVGFVLRWLSWFQRRVFFPFYSMWKFLGKKFVFGISFCAKGIIGKMLFTWHFVLSEKKKKKKEKDHLKDHLKEGVYWVFYSKRKLFIVKRMFSWHFILSETIHWKAAIYVHFILSENNSLESGCLRGILF